MAKQIINIGSSENKGDGDPIRTAFNKVNENFSELYAGNFADPSNIGVPFLPEADGTIDLGSETRRWSEIHVKDFIYLGNVRLSVDADNNLIIGGGAISKADVQGDIFSDDSTKVFDSATNTFSGKFDGDLTGSVFADDSTVIIDGVNGRVTPSSFLAPQMTQAQIDATTPEFGMVVYNTTTGKFQGYAADANNDSVAAWADLH